jgi:hypothetical protein
VREVDDAAFGRLTGAEQATPDGLLRKLLAG